MLISEEIKSILYSCYIKIQTSILLLYKIEYYIIILIRILFIFNGTSHYYLNEHIRKNSTSPKEAEAIIS